MNGCGAFSTGGRNIPKAKAFLPGVNKAGISLCWESTKLISGSKNKENNLSVNNLVFNKLSAQNCKKLHIAEKAIRLKVLRGKAQSYYGPSRIIIN
ncbi:MAG: hypothetical protein WCR72_06005 [Bacteroidota bacterium]